MTYRNASTSAMSMSTVRDMTSLLLFHQCSTKSLLVFFFLERRRQSQKLRQCCQHYFRFLAVELYPRGLSILLWGVFILAVLAFLLFISMRVNRLHPTNLFCISACSSLVLGGYGLLIYMMYNFMGNVGRETATAAGYDWLQPLAFVFSAQQGRALSLFIMGIYAVAFVCIVVTQIVLSLKVETDCTRCYCVYFIRNKTWYHLKNEIRDIV
jgi:hypothetical protein